MRWERIALLILLFVVAVGANSESRSLAAADSVPHADAAYREQVRPLLQKFCFECHGEKPANNALRLDSLAVDFLNPHAASVWKEVASRVVDSSENKMPPEDKPRPSATELKTLRDWIEAKDAAVSAADAASQKAEGRSLLRRLNRVEYSNTQVLPITFLKL